MEQKVKEKSISIFYCYADEDERLRKKLEDHLVLLQQQELIAGWHKGNIRAGTERLSEIETHLDTAQIILLLVSSSFLASKDCHIEMIRALERSEAGSARVIPIILSSVDWADAPFSKLQPLPTGGEPVTGRKGRNTDKAFAEVAQGIRKVVEELRSQSSISGPDTLRDYLHWMIKGNCFLDLRGILQTQPQVQIPLDEVYISLRAQREEMPSTVDHRFGEKERDEREANLTTTELPLEEMKDLRERFWERGKDVKGPVLELAEVVTHHKKVVILGDPGCGKTMLLRYLALKHAQALYAGRSEAGSDLGIAHFPLLLHIADYVEYGMPKGRSLSDYLADYCKMHECPDRGLRELLTSKLTEGNCLILLDGLDEIVSADDRRNAAQRVEEFIRYHDNHSNRFVVTSRVAGYRSAPLGDSFTCYTVQEMEESQIRRFLERWYSVVEAARRPDISLQERENTVRREVGAIMRSVQTIPGIQHLATNPLLLRLLVLIHRTDTQLPQKRIELYTRAADTLTHTWRMTQGVSEQALALLKEEYLTPMLGKLAYWMHMNTSTGIATKQDVYRELGQEWARLQKLPWDEDDPNIKIDVQTFLLAVREHTGLFVEHAPKRYSFMHLTFEEYYAARYLVARSKDQAKRIRQHLHDPRWEEPILLALGFVGLDSPDDATELLETAILAEGEDAQSLGFAPSKYEEWLGRDFLFAVRCLRDDIPMRSKRRQQLMERMVDELLYESGLAMFEQYRKALEERLPWLWWVQEGDTIVIPRLLAALHESEVWVRARAAECLGLMRDASPEVVKPLIVALQDTNTYVRQQVFRSLAPLWSLSPEVQKALITTFDVYRPSSFQQPTEEESEVRLDYKLNRWVAALQQSTDIEVRVEAASSLGIMGAWAKEPQDICHALIKALQQDVEAEVRAEAAMSLRGEMWQEVPEVLNALVMVLKCDTQANVRSSAVWSLEQLKDTSSEILDALVMVLQQEPDVWVRSRVAECLGRLGKALPQVLEALTAVLQQDIEVDVRSMAAWSLVQLGHQGPGDISIFLDGLRGAKFPNVRSDCACLLGELGQADEQTQQALWHGLLDGRGYVRKACAQAFVQLSQRFPERQAGIESRLVQALANPAFKQQDDPDPDEPGIERPAYDYAYDALWLIVTRSLTREKRLMSS